MTKTLKAIAIASAVLVLWLPALGQTKFNPDGAFFNIGELPDGFKDFSGIYLNGRRLRRLPTQSLQLKTSSILAILRLRLLAPYGGRDIPGN